MQQLWKTVLKTAVAVPATYGAGVGAVSAFPAAELHDLKGSGVALVSVASYQANDPIEDRWVYGTRSNMFIGAVLDGHGGWQASEFAKNNLVQAITAECTHNANNSDPSQIAAAMVRAYQRTDRAFIDKVRGAFEVGYGAVAHTGCCALTAVVSDNAVVVANAGDCRAVLGVVSSTGFAGSSAAGGNGSSLSSSSSSGSSAAVPGEDTAVTHAGHAAPVEGSTAASGSSKSSKLFISALALSEDHNSRMPREVARLKAAHPGEEDIVICKSPQACYVKGRLQPTRALGDAYLKYSEFNAPAGNRQRGRNIPPPYTPPYITGTPEVRIYRVNPEKEHLQLKWGRDFSRQEMEDADKQLSHLRFFDYTPAAQAQLLNRNAKGSSSGSSAGTASAGFQDYSFLVLGCDGLWDVMTNEEVVQFVAEDAGDKSTVARRIVERVLEKEADNANMSLSQLARVQPGRGRRVLHDDVTVMVIFLGQPPARKGDAAAEGGAGAGSKSGWWFLK